MTREKEISKVASEYTENYGYFNVDLDDVGCGFMDGVKWADEHPVNPWHYAKDGDLPPFNKVCLFNCNGTTYIGFVRGDESLYLENNLDLSLSINDINYWMEIPELPTELEKEEL